MIQVIKKAFILIVVVVSSINAVSQNYSLKDHLNAKVSASYYYTYNTRIQTIPWWSPFYKWLIFKEINLRAEVNYSMFNCVDFGIYGGVQRYYYLDIRALEASFEETEEEIEDITWNTDTFRNYYAPTFGINIYFHPLKLLLKDKSRYDVYLAVKYGGVYFSRWYYSVPCFIISIVPFNVIEGNHNPYRHEYGIGIGGAVYFWQIVGLYCEASYGQFSHYPEFFRIPYNVRAGITVKFDAIK